jgi:hypothetical protein
MTRRLFVVALFLAVASAATFAHDDYRIIGILEKVSANTIAVKQTRDKKVISMLMEAGTLITRDKKKVSRSALEAGLSVVVDARGDDIDDLTVVEIKLVPSLPLK